MVRILQESSSYRPSTLVKIFHNLPHLNVSLHLVNSTFAPDTELYRESIGILGSLPAACLIVCLFLLLVYLLTRCCDQKPRPKHSIIVIKWSLGLFAVLSCALIGAGLYGSDDLHNGMEQLITAARMINERIERVQSQTNAIETSLEVGIPRIMVHLVDVFDKSVHNQTARSLLFTEMNLFNESINTSLISSKDISKPLKHLNIQQTIMMIRAGENIRFPATLVVSCTLFVFCIILLFGVFRHSRCALVIFSVMGLFAVIISFLISSVYLAGAVATGDFCMFPDVFVEHSAPPSIQADILAYYISCENTRDNPFSVIVRKGTAAVKEMSTHLNTMARLANNLYDPADIHPQLDMLVSEVNLVSEKMSSLAALLDCRPVHHEYMQMIMAVCDMGLFGLTIMLGSSIVSGFFFMILEWLDSHAWIYIRKKRDISANGSGFRGNPIGTISSQRIESNQYATLNRKFRTLDHPARGRHGVTFDAPGSSYTLGHKKQNRDGPGQYSTLSRKCKTLEANDFY